MGRVARHTISTPKYQQSPTSAPGHDAAAARDTQQDNSNSRTILLAVDESPDSDFAFDWAMEQLQRPGDNFKLVHCIPALQPGRLVAVQGAGLLRVPHVDPSLVAEKAFVEADSKLSRKFMAKMEQAGAKGSFQVLHGTATAATPTVDAKAGISATVCNTAKAERAAAVVVASSSRGGIREALLGSVAANLVHHCDVPVVVLHKPKAAQQQQQRGQEDVAWLLSATAEDLAGSAGAAAGQQAGQQAARHIVVAVDDSDEGSWSVGWVVQHLWRQGDLLHVLHVVPALPAHMSYSLAPDGMMYSLPLPQLEEAQVEESHWRQLLLERLGPMLSSQGVNFQLDVITDYGSDPLQGVAAAVVATAERLNAAALVLCGHSKGTMAEWLLGSVSDFAAHHAAVPVVVLHGSQFAEQTFTPYSPGA
ncbi:hypothetical protein OEZ85_013843 [Tetradesmus obliquus]|uniref:UspA domain-containing protein n=1 Tax=Tetradesmus obliquus TaxID=3088 RepID=A0ABY8U6M3_TETOB|nr:hypothetical protein OEZ85_013843 [Tetradesmus obliquus]